MIRSYGKLLLVALVGVMLIVDGVFPVVPSSLPSSSIPSANPPSSTSSPSGIYGYGNKYRVNLHGFQTPNRVRLASSRAALFTFRQGLLKMREKGIITTGRYTVDMNNASVDEYKALDGSNKVFKIQHTVRVRGSRDLKCVTFGYYRQQSWVAGMVDVACRPL